MDTVNLIVIGDIFPKKNGSLFIEGKKERLFDQKILDLFENADFSVCNLEGALTGSDNAVPKRGLHLKASPECINAIKEAVIGYVSLANNHSPDFGTEGIKETIRTLENNGLSHFGAGFNENDKNYIQITKNGLSIIIYGAAEKGFFASFPNEAAVNLYDDYTVCKELEALKNNVIIYLSFITAE